MRESEREREREGGREGEREGGGENERGRGEEKVRSERELSPQGGRGGRVHVHVYTFVRAVSTVEGTTRPSHG